MRATVTEPDLMELIRLTLDATCDKKWFALDRCK